MQNGSSSQPVNPLAITTMTLPRGTVGQSYSAQLSASGGTPPRTWSIVLGQLAAGLSLNSGTGAIIGTPTQAGDFSFTVGVVDSSLLQQETAVASLIGSIQPPPITITVKSLPTPALGQPYNAQLEASGGTPPYTWLIVGGSLPLGLELNASTGQIAGTPMEVGAFSFSIQVTDSSVPASSSSLIIPKHSAKLSA